MMKNIVKKLFISALIASVASMAAASATVVINVGDRSSHGILNLDKLIIKASTASNAPNAVVLSSGSKVGTTQICNTGLTLCKNVTDLWTGTDTHLTNSLTIQGNGTNAVVFTQDSNKTLNIVGSGSTTVSADSTNGKITIYSSGGTNGNHYTGYNRVANANNGVTNNSATNNNTYLNHVENNQVTSSNQIKGTGSVTVSANNGTITISGTDNNTWQQNTSSQDGYVTAPGNNDNMKGKVRKVDNNGEPGWGTDATSNITISGNTNRYCYKVSDTKINCDLDSGTLATQDDLQELSGDIYNDITNNITQIIQNSIPGTSGMWCQYFCDATEIKNNKTVCVAGHVECNSPAPTGGDGKWTGDSTIYPKNTSTTVAIGTASSGGYMLNVNGSSRFKQGYLIANFDKYGARFFNAMALLMTSYTGTWVNGAFTNKQKVSTVTGLAVNGPIAVGNPSNYIYIYADGSGNQRDRHYEIMGRNELAIGTQYGAFLYFTQKTGTFINHLEPLMYGNPENIGGGGGTCKPEGEGEGSTVVGKPEGDGGKGTCTSNSNVQTTMAYQLDPFDYPTAYQTFMVGVNTNQPNATLDVYGSLRIGNNCVPAFCDADHAGTMMYYESYGGHIAVCSQNPLDNTQYLWYDLKMELNTDEYGKPNGYTTECYGPAPGSHPVPHPEPYVMSEEMVYEPVVLDY